MIHLERLCGTPLLLDGLRSFVESIYGDAKGEPPSSRLTNADLPEEVLFLEQFGHLHPRAQRDWFNYGFVWPFQLNRRQDTLIIQGREHIEEVGYVRNAQNKWEICARNPRTGSEWRKLEGDPLEWWITVWLGSLSYRTPSTRVSEDRDWEEFRPDTPPLWSGGSSGILDSFHRLRSRERNHTHQFWWDEDSVQLYHEHLWDTDIDGEFFPSKIRRISKVEA